MKSRLPRGKGRQAKPVTGIVYGRKTVESYRGNKENSTEIWAQEIRRTTQTIVLLGKSPRQYGKRKSLNS
jgi:hypothetical protein